MSPRADESPLEAVLWHAGHNCAPVFRNGVNIRRVGITLPADDFAALIEEIEAPMASRSGELLRDVMPWVYRDPGHIVIDGDIHVMAQR